MQNIKVELKLFEYVEDFKYLDVNINQRYIMHDKIWPRLSSVRHFQ